MSNQGGNSFFTTTTSSMPSDTVVQALTSTITAGLFHKNKKAIELAVLISAVSMCAAYYIDTVVSVQVCVSDDNKTAFECSRTDSKTNSRKLSKLLVPSEDSSEQSWKVLGWGLLGLLGGGVVSVVGTLIAQNVAESRSMPKTKEIDRAKLISVCPELQDMGVQSSLCQKLLVELPRIDPLDRQALSARASALAEKFEVSKDALKALVSVDGKTPGGVSRVSSNEFETATGRRPVPYDAGLLYYTLVAFTQPIHWGTEKANNYCFGPRSPLSLAQRNIVANITGPLEIDNHLDWDKLSRACHYSLVTNTLLWAPSRMAQSFVIRIEIGTSSARTIQSQILMQRPYRWQTMGGIHEETIYRKVQIVGGLSTLGGWFSLSQEEQNFLIQYWGVQPPPLQGRLRIMAGWSANSVVLSKLAGILMNVSENGTDSEVYAIARANSTTPAQVGLQLKNADGDTGTQYVEQNADMIKDLAEVLRFQVTMDEEMTDSTSSRLTKYLDKMVAYNNHMISRGILFQWAGFATDAVRSKIYRFLKGDGVDKSAARDFEAIINSDLTAFSNANWKWTIPEKSFVVHSPTGSVVFVASPEAEYTFDTDTIKATQYVRVQIHANTIADTTFQVDLDAPATEYYPTELHPSTPQHPSAANGFTLTAKGYSTSLPMSFIQCHVPTHSNEMVDMAVTAMRKICLNEMPLPAKVDGIPPEVEPLFRKVNEECCGRRFSNIKWGGIYTLMNCRITQIQIVRELMLQSLAQVGRGEGFSPDDFAQDVKKPNFLRSASDTASATVAATSDALRSGADAVLEVAGRTVDAARSVASSVIPGSDSPVDNSRIEAVADAIGAGNFTKIQADIQNLKATSNSDRKEAFNAKVTALENALPAMNAIIKVRQQYADLQTEIEAKIKDLERTNVDEKNRLCIPLLQDTVAQSYERLKEFNRADRSDPALGQIDRRLVKLRSLIRLVKQQLSKLSFLGNVLQLPLCPAPTAMAGETGVNIKALLEDASDAEDSSKLFELYEELYNLTVTKYQEIENQIDTEGKREVLEAFKNTQKLSPVVVTKKTDLETAIAKAEDDRKNLQDQLTAIIGAAGGED